MRNFLLIAVVLSLFLGVATATAAEKSVSELVTALGAEKESVRREAIDALGAMGEKAADAVPALAALLKDKSAAVRGHAAESLGEIGAPAKSAAPGIVALFGDADKTVRREAADALARIRPGPKVVLPLLIELIEDAEPSVRLRALHLLAEHKDKAIPALVEALADEDTVYWACVVLSEIGPDADAAVPALIETLGDKRPGVRREACIALAQIGKASAPAIAALAKMLDDEHNGVPATYALGTIGQLPDDVEAAIKANAKSSDVVLSTVSTWAMAKLDPENKSLMRRAVKRLAARLKDDEPRHREAAVRALVDLDPDLEIARPIFKEVMEDLSPEARDAVLDVVAAFGDKMVPRLIDTLENDKESRARAAAILARMGPAAKDAVPALCAALSDDDSETRNEVLFALGAIGPDSKAAVPAITRALKDADMNVRYAACYALCQIGPGAASAKPGLLENLAGADQFLAVSSACALAQIDPKCPVCAAKSVPVLIHALDEPDAITRVHAVQALGALGPLAKDAVPALKKTLQDNNQDIRAMAAKALEAIGS
jgi:HEAT repeat protein